MIRFGFSVAAALVVAAPVWASDPPVFSDGPPPPVAFPAAGLAPPEMLPPLPPLMSGAPGLGAAVAPEWYGPPGMPPGAPPAAPGATGVDPCDFPFDPCYPFQCSGPGKVAAASWVRGDWLFWDFRKTPVPVLIATGNPNLPNPAIPGRGNFTPLGAGPRDLGQFNGVRLTVGHWFDRDGELGVEFSGFVFGREGSALTFSDRTGTPVVSSPVTGANVVPAAYDFAFPGRFTGALTVQTATQLYAGEANLLHRWYGNGCVSFDTMLGYRYLQFDERVDLLGRSQNLGAVGTFNGGLLPQGVTVLTRDSFRGTTEFHGGQIGGRLEVRRDMFTLTAFGKGGAGANIQTLRVDGATTVTGFGVTRTAAGGLRALPTNIGRDTNTDFSLLAETGVELGFQMSKNLSLRVGYNLLFWSNVLRPGNSIDQTVSFSQVPIDPTFNAARAATRPVTVFRTSDFVAHGLVLGVIVDY